MLLSFYQPPFLEVLSYMTTQTSNTLKKTTNQNDPITDGRKVTKEQFKFILGQNLVDECFSHTSTPGFHPETLCRSSQGLAKNTVEQKISKAKVYITEQPLPLFLCRYSKCLVSKYATRKSPFKLWFFSPPPCFFFIILHVAITCRGDLIVCSFLLFVFPFAFRMGEDGRGWKQARSPSTNTGQVEVSTASDSVPGAELHGQEPA